jgi:hypothetical protein
MPDAIHNNGITLDFKQNTVVPGDFGLDIQAAGSPASQGIGCNASATVEDIEETVTASASSLGYDPQSGRYTYVWKTQKGWAGTCR